eukprot:CAMPEP_0184679616 /NCGR_PEP_ID=MMETSP0312-20130426/2459_1 /TAXON_ID=31354 /ORGANISM="Compsopogon coeruleus, Strain SAG 36.94" /LENGTH=212 /DNA_ID=CAMNT_0027129173 /DNA_START=253 /DNA_END=891 /DNA_ORIENTATION=-
MASRVLAVFFAAVLIFTCVDAQCPGRPKYQVKFIYRWTRSSHPIAYPSFPHFSSLVGVSHSKSYTFWRLNRLSSQGVKNIAELGSNGQAVREFRSDSRVFKYSVGSISGPVDVDMVTVTMNGPARQSFLSAASMIAPSPDWFLGFSGQQMCQNGRWRKSISGSLVGYDAGTDSGTTYNSANKVTSPARPIRRLSGSPTNGVRFGTYVVTRVA